MSLLWNNLLEGFSLNYFGTGTAGLPSDSDGVEKDLLKVPVHSCHLLDETGIYDIRDLLLLQ